MNLAVKALIIVAAICLPLGVFFGFWTDNPAWFLLSAIALVFFYAG